MGEMQTADEIIAQFVKPEWKQVAELVKMTARLQERHRAAKIAEQFSQNFDGIFSQAANDGRYTSRSISQAILADKEES